MSHPVDIRSSKIKLRTKFKKIRTEMSPKERSVCDARIRGRVLALREYKACQTVLCFVSTEIEVDTYGIIRQALKDGKTVGVPCCVDGTRFMHFYQIHSLEELAPRTFGVLEPDPEVATKITNFDSSICILPGLAFDRYGYRLGYGGGYYDRFLSKTYGTGIPIGVCYTSCTVPSLPHGRYDVPCQVLITEKYVRHPAALPIKKAGPKRP